MANEFDIFEASEFLSVFTMHLRNLLCAFGERYWRSLGMSFILQSSKENAFAIRLTTTREGKELADKIILLAPW